MKNFESVCLHTVDKFYKKRHKEGLIWQANEVTQDVYYFNDMIFLEKEGVEKILSISQFESLFQISFAPHLAFKNPSLLKKIILKTSKFHKQGRLSRHQLWQGAYFRKEILEPTHPIVSLKWINQHIGWGLFAKKAFEPGQYMGEYVGVIRKRERSDKKNGYCFEYPLAEEEDSPYVIDALDQGTLIRFINHSDQPNLTASLATVDHITHVLLIVKKPIQIGEQLTYDYGPNYWTYRPKPVST